MDGGASVETSVEPAVETDVSVSAEDDGAAFEIDAEGGALNFDFDAGLEF